jgi:hypothetical protein
LHLAKRKQWDLFFTLQQAETLEDQKFSESFLTAKNKLVNDIVKYVTWAKDYARIVAGR